MLTIESLRESLSNYSDAYSDDTEFIEKLFAVGIISPMEREELLYPEEFEEPEEKLTIGERISFGLWQKVSGFYIAMWGFVWSSLAKAISPIIKAIWTEVRPAYIKFMVDHNPFITFDDEYIRFLPPTIRERALRYRENPTIPDIIWLSLYEFAITLGKLLSYIGVIQAKSQKELNKEYSPEIPDIGSLVRYNWRHPDQQGIVMEKARELGFERSEVDILAKAGKPLLEIQFIKDLYLRGIFTEALAITSLKDMGYDEADAKNIIELFYYIPSPPDQVRFAVREAFYPEYVAKYGLDAEYPQEFEDGVKKVGVSPEWAKMYWRSHWELPSLLMGFEMLHRGVINEETLDDLFKAADIMPYWREHIRAISYNPLTRVDVRRMHKIGVLDRDDVKRAYLNVGYNDKNAELMTEFTILYNSESERDLTKADILGAYKRRLLTLEDTTTLLSDMGYSTSETGVLISRVDYDLEVSRKKIVLANLKKGYIRGTIDDVELNNRFGTLDMAGTETTELIELWDTEKQDKSRSLTRTDLDKMSKAGVINKDTYINELKLLNYNDRDIALLVKLTTGKKM